MASYVNTARHPLVLSDGRVVPSGEGFDAKPDAAQVHLDSGEAIETESEPEPTKTRRESK